MKKPTGKLAFAYQTIMALEAKIEEMEKRHDHVTAMWSRELHSALNVIDVVCEYHVPKINPLSDTAIIIAKATAERLRGVTNEDAIAQGTVAFQCADTVHLTDVGNI